MTKVLEAVRQLRGEAHPKVQVKNCDLAVAHGTGGLLGVRHAASTCILERARATSKKMSTPVGNPETARSGTRPRLENS